MSNPYDKYYYINFVQCFEKVLCNIVPLCEKCIKMQWIIVILTYSIFLFLWYNKGTVKQGHPEQYMCFFITPLINSLTPNREFISLCNKKRWGSRKGSPIFILLLPAVGLLLLLLLLLSALTLCLGRLILNELDIHCLLLAVAGNGHADRITHTVAV